MKKVLYLYNSAVKNLPSKGISSFNYTAYNAITSLGIEYHGNTFSQEASKYYEDTNIYLHLVQIYRNPFSKDVLTAYRQLMKLLKDEQFDIIHCNTPIGGFLGRICGKKAGVSKIIYQAHGFHFYKGAPILNWLLYYPIERWLAKYTDTIITINTEDYHLAKKKFHLKNNGKVYYVPGVGIDLSSFKLSSDTRKKKRLELGIEDNDIVLISAGRLDKNKNNAITLKALAMIPNVKLLLCGDGDEKESLLTLTESLKLTDRVFFLGNRSDIKELYQAADIFVLSSYREGLSRSIMEAMASGLPCIVSNIRGNTDLIVEGSGGYLFSPRNDVALANAINKLVSSKEIRKSFSIFNLKKIETFSNNKIIDILRNIYTANVNSNDLSK